MPTPTNEVIVEKLNGLDKLINLKFEQNQKEHETIISHQKKTNGNVKKNTSYRFYMTGAVAVLAVIFSIVIKQVMAQGGM